MALTQEQIEEKSMELRKQQHLMTVKLECLKLAVPTSTSAIVVLENAKKYYDFVSEQSTEE